MKKHLFWKVTLSLFLVSTNVFAGVTQVGVLSEGACWFEYKEALKVASFNDKTAYLGTKEQIEANLESLLGDVQHQKINEMNLALHCGGYGASLVAKVTTDSNTFCVWTRFEKGKLVARSIGTLNDSGKSNELCDGHKWGEFILGVNDSRLISELTGAKWASVIKEVSSISTNVYKVSLVKDYEFRESEVMNQLEENFTGKNFIRYMEFNDYHHPIGEFIPLK